MRDDYPHLARIVRLSSGRVLVNRCEDCGGYMMLGYLVVLRVVCLRCLSRSYQLSDLERRCVELHSAWP